MEVQVPGISAGFENRPHILYASPSSLHPLYRASRATTPATPTRPLAIMVTAGKAAAEDEVVDAALDLAPLSVDEALAPTELATEEAEEATEDAEDWTDAVTELADSPTAPVELEEPPDAAPGE
jgi:hypothetical protein